VGSPRNLKRSFESILQYHRNKGIRAKHFMKRPVPIVALQLIKTTNMYSHVDCGRNKDRVQETILLHFTMRLFAKHIIMIIFKQKTCSSIMFSNYFQIIILFLFCPPLFLEGKVLFGNYNQNLCLFLLSHREV